MKNFLIILVFLFFLGGCSFLGDGDIPVYFDGTGEFSKKINTYLINSKEAFEIVEKSKEPSFKVIRQGEALGFLVDVDIPAPLDQESHLWLKKEPYLIIGDYYFFVPLSKMYPRLSGYYLNGYTGRLEFRVSEDIISGRTKFISKDIFTKIEVLSEGIDRNE